MAIFLGETKFDDAPDHDRQQDVAYRMLFICRISDQPLRRCICMFVLPMKSWEHILRSIEIPCPRSV